MILDPYPPSVQTTSLNKHLQGLTGGLKAKVLWTYSTSARLQEQLCALTRGDWSGEECSPPGLKGPSSSGPSRVKDVPWGPRHPPGPSSGPTALGYGQVSPGLPRPSTPLSVTAPQLQLGPLPSVCSAVRF